MLRDTLQNLKRITYNEAVIIDVSESFLDTIRNASSTTRTLIEIQKV